MATPQKKSTTKQNSERRPDGKKWAKYSTKTPESEARKQKRIRYFEFLHEHKVRNGGLGLRELRRIKSGKRKVDAGAL
jgi:hypothetical protein